MCLQYKSNYESVFSEIGIFFFILVLKIINQLKYVTKLGLCIDYSKFIRYHVEKLSYDSSSTIG